MFLFVKCVQIAHEGLVIFSFLSLEYFYNLYFQLTYYVYHHRGAFHIMAFIPTNLPIKINLNAKFSIHVFPWKLLINSQFSRSCTDRGSNTDLCRRGSTKVKARKSILFTEGSPEVERKSEHLFDIIITLYVAMFALGD